MHINEENDLRLVCPPHFWNQTYTLGLTWTGSSCLVIIASAKWLQHLQALFSRSTKDSSEDMWFIHSSEWSLPAEEAFIMNQNYFIISSAFEKNVLFSKINWRIPLRDIPLSSVQMMLLMLTCHHKEAMRVQPRLKLLPYDTTQPLIFCKQTGVMGSFFNTKYISMKTYYTTARIYTHC